MRNIVSFNDNWKFIKNAADEVEAAKGEGESIALPHTWNAVDGQDGGHDYHRGTCWYVKNLQNRKRMKQIKPISNFVELQ